MAGAVTLYTCGRCGDSHPWEELDPRAGAYDLLCAGCLAEINAATASNIRSDEDAGE